MVHTKIWAEIKIKITSVSAVPAEWVFFSMMSPGYVTFNVTAHILTTFHFSFPLLRHSPPSYSFNFCFISSLRFSWSRVVIGFQLKIIILHFLISIIGTQTKVKIRLYSATDYLEYRQKIENIFLLREPSLCYPFTRSFSKQIEREIS